MSPHVTDSPEAQSAAAVLMVRPARFAANPHTAASNFFQHATALNVDESTQEKALLEFDRLADALMRSGVDVVVAQDSAAPEKPDAVFPNNWLSLHSDGTLVLYPMLAANRRWERRDDILRQIVGAGYTIKRTIDFSHHESENRFLEGTGSLVLDRAHAVAFACLSPRTDLVVLGDFAQQLDYELVIFEAVDVGGKPVYHTNVSMTIGTHFTVVCGEAIRDPTQRCAVFSKLHANGRELIDVSMTQMNSFACNSLELDSARGPVIAMSSTAWRAFDTQQRALLERFGNILIAEIPVIEHFGGGSVRCMLAEIHLSKRLHCLVS